MAKTSIVKNHDYISVRIKFDAGKLNLTANRWGTKATGDLSLGSDFELAAGAFDNFYTTNGAHNADDRMEKVKSVAEASADIKDFIEKMKSASL